MTDLEPLPLFEFHGKTFERDRDGARLSAQALRVFKFMSDNRWHTLREISAATGDPEASCSARLRDFRKPMYNLRVNVEHEYVTRGLWRYRLTRQ
jgi:hypothetical protein